MFPSKPAVLPALRWLWLAGALLTVLATGAATSMLNPALPAIAAELRSADVRWLTWLATGGALAFAVLVVPAAIAGDLLGHVRVHLVGVVGFIATSAAAALTHSPDALVLARVGQGAAAAFIVPQVVGYARRHLPTIERLVAYSLFALVFVAGPTLGTSLGVETVYYKGWRPLFWILVLVVAYAGLSAIPVLSQRVPVRFDPLALAVGLLAVPAVFGIAYPLVARPTAEWPGWYPVLLVAGALLFIGCLGIEAYRRGWRAGLVVPLVALLVLVSGGHRILLGILFQFSTGLTTRSVTAAELVPSSGVVLGAALAAVFAVWLDGRIATGIGIAVLALGVASQFPLLGSGYQDYHIGALAIDTTLVGMGLALTLATLIRTGGSTAGPASPSTAAAPEPASAVPALLFAAVPLGTFLGGTLVDVMLSHRSLGEIQAQFDVRLLRHDTVAVLVASLVVLAVAALLALLLTPPGREAVDRS
jgi:MFS family permease